MNTLNLFENFGYNNRQIKKIFAYYERKQCCTLENTSLVIKIINKLISYGFTKEEIIKISSRFPAIFVRKPEDIDRKIEFYMSLSLTKLEVKNAFLKLPQLISLADESVKKKIEVLEELGIDRLVVLKILKAFPNILSISIENYRIKYSWIKAIGLEKDEIAYVFKNAPQIFGLSIERLDENRSCLLNYFGADVVANIIREFPNVLCLKKSTLEEKLAFLKDNGLLGFIADRPNALRQSIKLTKARMTFLNRIGKTKDDIDPNHLFTENYYFYCKYKIHKDELLKLVDLQK